MGVSVGALYALRQKPQSNGAMPGSGIQSIRVQRFPSDGFAASFCAMRY